jgi:glutathione S-transferase
LKAVHPLGKFPVITDSDNGRVIAESGAIIDYILRRHGNGRLQPTPPALTALLNCHFASFADSNICEREIDAADSR